MWVSKDSLNYLGFQINTDGVRVPDDKVEAIRAPVLPKKVFRLNV